MDDKSIIKLSLAISIVGIIGLLAVSQIVEAEKVPVSSITTSMIGNKITIEGVASHVSTSKGTMFLSVDDGSTINVVIFERAARGIIIEDGRNVTITGTVSMYKASLEIIADTIKVL